jgi:hypothetical protein
MTRDELHALVAAEWLAQGLPERVEDDEALDAVAALPRPLEQEGDAAQRGRRRQRSGSGHDLHITNRPRTCDDRR